MSEVEEATALANAVNLLQDLPGLGVVLVHKMQSDKWSDRKDGLDQVSEWTTTREMEARVQGAAAAAAGAGAAQGQQEEQQQQQTATVSVEKRLELSNEFAAHCALLQPAIEQNVLPWCSPRARACANSLNSTGPLLTGLEARLTNAPTSWFLHCLTRLTARTSACSARLVSACSTYATLRTGLGCRW